VNHLVTIVLLALGVVAVTALAKQLRTSSPVLLVAAGVLVALIPGVPSIRLDPEIVLFVLLPPLLYSASLNSSLIAIRANARSILLLAVGMVLLSTLVVGLTLYVLLPEVTVAAGIALGAVVGPPDAVAATAVARRAGLPRRLVTILEGESLFNDATALTTLRVAVGAVGVAGGVSAFGPIRDFLQASVGGAAIGLAAGFILGLLRTHYPHPILNTSLSLLAPFAIYLAGEEAHTSGVIAVVVAGLMLAHRSPADQEPAARLSETALWSTVQFLLEGSVFGLIGLQLPDIVSGVHEPIGVIFAVCGSVLGVTLAVRPLWIFGLSYIAGIVPWTDRGRPQWQSLAVISWAGMRGVVSLAAAETLPLDFPRRNLLLLVTVVVIVGTLGAQGLSLPWLIRKVGVSPPDPRQDALQVAHAQEQAGRAALQRLDELNEAEDPPEGIVTQLRRQVEFRTFTDWERLGAPGGDEAPTRIFARLRREMVAAERAVFIRLRDSGELDEEVLRRIQRRLDLEESLLMGLDESFAELEGHQDVLPPSAAPACVDLKKARAEVGTAEPMECVDCVAEHRRDWVHLRRCLTCDHVACCDSSPARHADGHFAETGHPVMGSAEPGENWRWCYRHSKLG
jgi:CPA1 family monovalent cation:H+ antiporter